MKSKDKADSTGQGSTTIFGKINSCVSKNLPLFLTEKDNNVRNLKNDIHFLIGKLFLKMFT